MASFGSAGDIPSNFLSSDAALEDASASSRLQAEEFRAEDLDGILEGVSGSGNLNFAVLQAGLTDGGALANDGNYISFDGVGINSEDAASLGRQALGDAVQSFGAVLPQAPSFGGDSALSGAQGGAIHIEDSGPKAFQTSSGVSNGSSFSAQFSGAPMGAVINDIETAPSPESRA